jgi:hypothetical protein
MFHARIASVSAALITAFALPVGIVDNNGSKHRD